MRRYVNKISLTIGASVGVMLATIVVLALAMTGAGGREDLAERPTPVQEAITRTPEPGVARLLIPKIEVDAKVVPMGVDEYGRMESPDNAYDVAWFRFSSMPGEGGNVVLSGHLDFHDVGRAVLWKMVHPDSPEEALKEGDIVQVLLEDGAVYEYEVVALWEVEAETADIADINDILIGDSTRESVTVMTCSGTFDAQKREYSHRMILRAERVDSPSRSRVGLLALAAAVPLMLTAAVAWRRRRAA